MEKYAEVILAKEKMGQGYFGQGIMVLRKIYLKKVTAPFISWEKSLSPYFLRKIFVTRFQGIFLASLRLPILFWFSNYLVNLTTFKKSLSGHIFTLAKSTFVN